MSSFIKQLTLILIASIALYACRYKQSLQIVEGADLQHFDSSVSAVDSGIISIIAPYSTMLAEEMSEVIAYSAQSMEKARPQSLLGNFTCDILLGAHYEVEPQICFMNYGGLRAPLPKGEIKKYHIFELMPFDNQLVLVKMSRSQVTDLLKLGVQKGGEPFGSTIGISVLVKNNQFVSWSIDSQSIVKTSDSLWVLTNDYIYNGGDGYSIFKKSDEVIHTGLLYRDVIMSELQEKHGSKKPFQVKLDKRIVYE